MPAARIMCLLLVVAAFPGVLPAAGRRTIERDTIPAHWLFRDDSARVWHQATVPGCVHADLLNNGIIPDPYAGLNERQLQWIGERDWVYQSTFDLPPTLLKHDSIDLVFKGLDTYATVTLNDEVILHTDNMFREWRKECKARLRLQGNVLTVSFRNVFDAVRAKVHDAPFPLQALAGNGPDNPRAAMYVRKAQYQFGWRGGPRLVTCGVWRPVFLEGWSGFRIRGARVTQENVSLLAAGIGTTVEVCSIKDRWIHAVLTVDGASLAMADTLLRAGTNRLTLQGTLHSPVLWWPKGMGEQYRYHLDVTVTSTEGDRDVFESRVGVRSLSVVRDRDSLGRGMALRVNTVPLFIKGANYIPPGNVQTRTGRAREEALVHAAADANMNMLRVWGGGVYEEDAFYDLCDAQGILVWQDCMFAGAMYPADEAFLANVRQEILENVARLRNHPCIALYCGNDETEISWYQKGWKQQYPPAIQENYEWDMHQLFSKVIADAVREADPDRYYQPTTPGAGYRDISSMDGDVHSWDVGQGGASFEGYARGSARFVTGYGFPSCPELSTIARFARPEERQLHSPVMLAHQPRDGEDESRIIATYLDRYIGVPAPFAMYPYASQVLQAEGMKMAIQAHRRAMPACMGTLYWQLDDCWPATSCSSIDYFGKWKALHYYVRRLYANVIVAPVDTGEVVEFSLVSDSAATLTGILEIHAFAFDGREIFRKDELALVRPRSRTVVAAIPKREVCAGLDERSVVIVATFRVGPTTVAEETFELQYPRDLALLPPGIHVAATPGDSAVILTVTCDSFAKDVAVTCEDVEGSFTDNYFDLLPGRPREIRFVPEAKSERPPTFTTVSLIDILH